LGDPAAVARLVRGELPRVYNLCLRLTQNPADADDLSQEVFIKAVRALEAFRGQSSFSTWIYRIAMNTWKNRVRYEKRRHMTAHVSINRTDETENGTLPELDLEDPTPRPDQSFERREKNEQVMRALRLLDDDDRAIIVLRDVEDRSYEEIADIMDLNLGTVKSRLSRAREQLRHIFRVEEEGTV
jgi:RNA polymerase sigma-70 factor (ECF subfamily)